MDEAKLAASVHKTNTCVSCHADITAKHPDDNVPAQPVNCASCHEQQSESYGASVHGLALQGRARTPRRAATATSRTTSCRRRRRLRRCIFPSGRDLRRVPRPGGQGRGGKRARQGRGRRARDAPTCTDCHSEHKIAGAQEQFAAEDFRRGLQPLPRLGAANTKYNLPADRVKTFFESYHGLAAQYGSTVAANCASCHGYHKILPSTDPRFDHQHQPTWSRPAANAIPAPTKSSSRQDPRGPGRDKPDGRDLAGRINWWVRRIYLVLIFGTIGFMLVHNSLLFQQKVARAIARHGRPVLRMSLSQRWQHFVLAVSFIILAVTGFALKFPDSWLARMLGSSEPFRRWTHRIAGIVLLLVGALPSDLSA